MSAEVKAALEAAHVALMNAAVLMVPRYPRQATQLAGAAAMILSDWLPAMDVEAAAVTAAAQEAGK